MTTVHVFITSKSYTHHGRITHFTCTSKNIILILTQFNVQATATKEFYLYLSSPFSVSAWLSASFQDTVDPRVSMFSNFGFHVKLSINYTFQWTFWWIIERRAIYLQKRIFELNYLAAKEWIANYVTRVTLQHFFNWCFTIAIPITNFGYMWRSLISICVLN